MKQLVCPVCGSEKWIRRYSIRAWHIEECAACAFARINPPPARERRAEYYSKEEVVKRNLEEKSFLQNLSRSIKRLFSRVSGRGKNDIFYNKLVEHIPLGSKVLDVGCGDGSFLRQAKDDFVCTGIEISEYLASLAMKDKDITVVTGNFLDSDFAAGTFDAITMISLFEHIEDPLGVADRCFKLLKDGGILLLKTVNYGCLNRVIRKNKWTGFRPPDHVAYFNPANLKMLLKKTGFTKIKVHSLPFNDNMYCEAFK